MGRIATFPIVGAATGAAFAAGSASATETPHERYQRSKGEFVEAMKALYPGAGEWRSVEYDDSGDLRPMFLIIGHREVVK